MISVIISRIVIILLGTLYPAYASYKAVKTKNVKEYVKWMMYWIVFALFTCIETFADIFISWLPFYYEIKVVFVIWLLSPATKGASILYRKFIHPQLSKREQDIDNYIAKASDQSYTTLLTLGRHGLNYATNIVITTALKGQSTIAEHVKKSYSLNDLSNDEQQKFISAPLDEVDYDEDELDNRMIQEQYEEEMAEKDLHETSGDRALPVRRRTTKAKEAELYPLPESDEANVRDVKITRSRRAYVHKEAYHYGTLPRKTKYNRPPINTSTPAGSDS